MNTDEQLNLYSELMAEVRVRLLDCRDRIALLRRLAPSEVKDGHYFEYELCCFHLRMICEAVASGCLILHHHIGIDRTTLDEWHAGEALKRLERINARCFPRAVKFKSTRGQHALEILPADLTFGQMNQIYGRLGSVLHRGKLKQVIERKRRYDMDSLIEWHNALGRLLETHIIVIRDKNQFFITDLFSGENEGVRVSLMLGSPAGFTNEI